MRTVIRVLKKKNAIFMENEDRDRIRLLLERSVVNSFRLIWSQGENSDTGEKETRSKKLENQVNLKRDGEKEGTHKKSKKKKSGRKKKKTKTKTKPKKERKKERKNRKDKE